jgi:hypothetical protein
MQYVLGLSAYTDQPVFEPSLFVSVRKPLGIEDYNDMSESLLKLQVRMYYRKWEEVNFQEKDGKKELQVNPSKDRLPLQDRQLRNRTKSR